MNANHRQVSLDIDMLSDLPAKSMLALVAKHRETKKFFEQAQRALTDFPGLFLQLEEMDIKVDFDPDLKLIRLLFSGDGPRLGKVWGELRRAGFQCTARPKKGDTQFSGWFAQEGYATISVYFTSTLCRRVQIGMQTVEQPIYETICGEELEVAAPVAPSNLAIVGGGEVSLADDTPF